MLELPVDSLNDESANCAPTCAAHAKRPPVTRRVLVVDDNVDAADTLAALVSAWGCEATVVLDGLAAIAALAAKPFDIAIVDIGLPAMDGYEVAKEVRKRWPDGGLRLVALTGYGQTADRQRALSGGFDAHFVKPVDIDKLRRAIDWQEDSSPESVE